MRPSEGVASIPNGNGTRDALHEEEPGPPAEVGSSTQNPFLAGAPIEVDSDVSLLEVDDNDDLEQDTVSLYAMGGYPQVPVTYQVEQPYENGSGSHPDCETIDSSRTLYAEDVDYVMENGRQYCGDYYMPIDQTEQTRQYVIHQVYLKLFDLELTTVPLENPKYILDIGTGIGEWAIGMAEKYPNCEVFGTDIAPIQPTQQVPMNVEFHIENAEDEWIRPANTVDLVHLRNMDGAFSDWRFIYQQAFDCIRPGGWIEIMDFDDFFANNNFLSFYPEDSPCVILTRAMMEAAEQLGRPRGVAHLNKQLLIDAGFVDVKETVHEVGIGPRANGNYGKFWLFAIVTGMEPNALRLLTRAGWDPDEVREMCNQAALQTKELADDPNSEDFVVNMRVLVARKPSQPGQWTARALGENGEMRMTGDCSGDESTIRSIMTSRSEETI